MKIILALLVAICVLSQAVEVRAQTTVPREKIPTDTLKDVNKQIEELYSPDMVRRANAAIRLAQMGPKAIPAIPFLIELLGDRTEGPPQNLMIGGKVVGWGPVIPYQYAQAALEVIGKPAIEPLVAALGDEDGVVRRRAAYVLGRMPEPDVVKALILALKNDNPIVRDLAGYALDERGSSLGVEHLIAALRDEDPRVRRTVTRVLGLRRDYGATEQLIGMLRDNDPEVRQEARESLERVTSQKFGEDLAKWQAWWEQEKAKKPESK